MESSTIARIKRRGQKIRLTGIIVALSVGVLLPVLFSTAVGIVTLALGKDSNPIITGVLIISFAAAALGSIVAVTVLLSKKSRTVRMQADLLANVTHDLRTPLASIRLYAQTIQSGQLDDDPVQMKKSIETIIRQTHWLDSMIDRLLIWRAAAKDRATLDMEVKPVGDAVKTAVDRFSGMLQEGEVQLQLHINSEKDVRHDSQAIGTIVLNLLINAYKYGGKDKQISVSVEDADMHVNICVADNGMGIASSEIRKIFEPFYRIDSKLAGKAAGAGLGLAIVQTVTIAHGGQVHVESRQHHGSKFTVVLPACKLKDNK